MAQEYFAAGRKRYGIILATRRSPHELVRKLLTIINNMTADEIEDHLLYI